MKGLNKNSLILVTGAAGMIGSGVVRCLNDRGYERLLLCDDLKHGEKWKNLVGKRFVDLVPKRLLMDYLKERTSDIEAVVHLGACSDTVETDADYLMENNFRFSVRLAEWALSYNKRLVYASSAATYGSGTLGFVDDEDALEALRPLNMYAFSKQLVDVWMKRTGALKRAAGLKYFNVFGPNENHKGRMASMVLKMMKRVKDEGAIHLYKSNDERFLDGGQMRDFIYVKDAVRMTCDFLEGPGLDQAGIFNIGRGTPTTWNELARSLFSSLDKPPVIHYIDMPLDLAGQYQNYTCAEMGKLHKIMAPAQTEMREAVREYVQDYLMKDARW